MKPVTLIQKKSLVEYDDIVEVAHSLGRELGVEIDSSGENWVLTLLPGSDLSENASKTFFLNALYNNTLRKKIKIQTDPIKNLIFAAAFSNIELE